MSGRVDPRLREWLEFYDELGLTPLFRGRGTGTGRPAPAAVAQVSPAAAVRFETPESSELPQAPEAQRFPAPAFPGAGPAQTASLFDMAGTGGAAGSEAGETLEDIRTDLGECTRCKLHSGRTNIVFGAGNPEASLVFVGEGPGADEDAQGLPFVGRAGRLLNRWIETLGMTRDDVYICNVVKCRPPGNRSPARDEVQTCSPFLYRQLGAIRPRLICCLGATALQALLGKSVSIGKMRGQFLDYRGVRMLPLYHPAYLLRPHPSQVERELKQDLQKIRDFLDS